MKRPLQIAFTLVLLAALTGCSAETQVSLSPSSSEPSSSELSSSEASSSKTSSSEASSSETSSSETPSSETSSSETSSSETPSSETSSSETSSSETSSSDASASKDGSFVAAASEGAPLLTEREPKPDDWFADAVFVGNSLTEGFYAWSGVTCGDRLASTSMSVLGACDAGGVALPDGTTGTILGGLTRKTYGKIYIQLGINEIAMRPADFRAAYAAMLDRFLEAQPDATFYILSLTPITKWKNDQNGYFTMAAVNAYNEQLFALAKEYGIWYIELCGPLAGADGYLSDDADTDGVHFVASHYALWYDELRTHYAD